MKFLLLLTLAFAADLPLCKKLKKMNGTECTSSKSKFAIDKSTLITNCNACFNFNGTTDDPWKAYGQKPKNKTHLLNSCLKRVERGDRSPFTPIKYFGRDGCPVSANLPQTTARGSGCPSGSFANAAANDRLTFTLIFDKFQVASSAKSTLDCEILVSLGGTRDTQFSLDKVDIRGFSLLTGDVSATLTSSYRFQSLRSDRQNATTSLVLDSSNTGDFIFSKNITTPMSLQCGEKAKPLLIISTRIELKGNLNNTAIFSVDSEDTKLSQSMAFTTSKC